MTRDDIIRMAREAGGGNCWWPMYTDTLERFAALVAAAERERNAKLCDALAVTSEVSYAKTCHECAEAIRKRK